LKDKIEKNDLIEKEKLKGEFFFLKKKERWKKDAKPSGSISRPALELFWRDLFDLTSLKKN